MGPSGPPGNGKEKYGMARFKLEPVNCRHGAPMGRPDVLPADPSRPVSLSLNRMRMIDGDYDSGGAYWGGNASTGHMWCAHSAPSEPLVLVFVRAWTARGAAVSVKQIVPGATCDLRSTRV